MFESPISNTAFILLVLGLLCAFAFEFVNGFHDTANAVATVIYTKTLKPSIAVLVSGVFNFLGVLTGLGVALKILSLLPPAMLVGSGSHAGLALVLALLVGAIIWNVGTWYLGIPASSSHTLIGSILGVGVAHVYVFGAGAKLPWDKATDVLLGLLISPLIGFTLAYLILLLLRSIAPKSEMHHAPKGDEPPPWWIRLTLIGTCSGVSFVHGSNDGQKGIGIVLLILIGILPGDYALNKQLSPEGLAHAKEAVVWVHEQVDHKDLSSLKPEKLKEIETVKKEATKLEAALTKYTTIHEIPIDKRLDIRNEITSFAKHASAVIPAPPTNPVWAFLFGAEKESHIKALGAPTDYAPFWVKILVALALGIGTTVGWKRIVVTIGEKIGKAHLTYAQGAAAELVAMGTIGIAAASGLPVSTTHVLSSGIAGTMVANKSGVQAETVSKMGLAWVLTMPASMVLSGVFYILFRLVLR